MIDTKIKSLQTASYERIIDIRTSQDKELESKPPNTGRRKETSVFNTTTENNSTVKRMSQKGEDP